MHDLLIEDAVVITMDEERRILDRGWVAVDGGRIVAVGAGSPPAGTEAIERLHARGGVLHPGLIDAHAHVGWGLARAAVPERFSEEEIMRCFDLPMLSVIDEAEEHLGTVLACVEMAMNGTTCFADTGSARIDLAATVEAVERVGIRGMVSCLNADAVPEVPELSRPLDECLERIESAVDRYRPDRGLAWACAGLLGMEAVSDELVVEAKRLADAAGVPLNLHKSFSADEVAACCARHGGRQPLESYGDIGVLDRNLTLVHLNHCAGAEADALAAARSAVVHCPTASMTYALGGSRHGRFPELVERGVPVALGTDSTHWGNAWDLTRSIYLAATVHKEGTGELPAITAEAALEMATLGGAEAVGRAGELGAIEPGMRADLIVHGTGRPEVHPAFDPVATLVFSGQARTVRQVFVEGRRVVADGRPVAVDLDGLLGEVDEASRRLLERLGFRRPSVWPVLRDYL